MDSKPEKDRDDDKSTDEKKPDSEAPPPIDKKIPESPETLRRRSEWFRKRSE